jgi:hypothetical protein
VFGTIGVTGLGFNSDAGAATTTFTSTEIGTSGSTGTFSMSGPWTMAWTFNCSNYGHAGNFIVSVKQSPTDIGPNELSISGTGTDYFYDTGTFSLEILSECRWSITVASSTAGPAATPATFTSTQIGTSGSAPEFTAYGPWTMSWNYNCSNWGTTGNFIVNIKEPASDNTFDIGPNELGPSGSGTDSYTDSGVFSLVIDSECEWSITVNGSAPPAPSPSPSPSPASSPGVTSGYDMVGSDGGVFVFPTGQSGGYYGSLPGDNVHVSNIVGMVPTPSDTGYFLVGSDGGVFSFGNAPFLGSLPGDNVSVNDIRGIVPTSDNGGYFLVGSDGGVFTFGDAPFLGSLPGSGVHINNVIGIAATPSDQGYWLVTSTGHVYSYGNAANYGSVTGSSSPVSGIDSTPDGGGYWVVAQNGGVYTFGDAGYFGSLPQSGVTPAKPVIGLVPTADQQGYWLIGSDGGIFAYGDASFQGSLPQVGVSVSDVVGAVPTKA